MSAVVLARLTFFYVNEPVVEMREKPTVQSEVVSAAYYSEKVGVLETLGEWLHVQTAVDGYQGWVPKRVVHQTDAELFKTPDVQVAKVTRVSALLYDKKDTAYGPILHLPFESQLEVQDATDKRWIKVRTVDGKDGYIQRGCVSFDAKVYTMQEIPALADQFLGLPYTWGGRSGFGYDCSGFVQMLYRQMNILLPRDSKDQINYSGFTATTREALKPGDLIFWGPAQDKIRHVGMYLGNDEFIHATTSEGMPWLHKSRLSDTEWRGESREGVTYSYRAFRTLKHE